MTAQGGVEPYQHSHGGKEKQLTLMFPAHGNASHFPAYCLNKTDFGQQALIFLMIAAKLFWHINFRNATFRIASLGSE